MKSKTSVIATAIAVSGMTLTLNAIGATDSHLPAAQKAGEVTYIMGGIGQTEADAIKHAAKYYPLELEFLLKAKPKAEYLSNVQVRIKDAHDKMVLNVNADGPYSAGQNARRQIYDQRRAQRQGRASPDRNLRHGSSARCVRVAVVTANGFRMHCRRRPSLRASRVATA